MLFILKQQFLKQQLKTIPDHLIFFIYYSKSFLFGGHVLIALVSYAPLMPLTTSASKPYIHTEKMSQNNEPLKHVTSHLQLYLLFHSFYDFSA